MGIIIMINNYFSQDKIQKLELTVTMKVSMNVWKEFAGTIVIHMISSAILRLPLLSEYMKNI